MSRKLFNFQRGWGCKAVGAYRGARARAVIYPSGSREPRPPLAYIGGELCSHRATVSYESPPRDVRGNRSITLLEYRRKCREEQRPPLVLSFESSSSIKLASWSLLHSLSLSFSLPPRSSLPLCSGWILRFGNTRGIDRAASTRISFLYLGPKETGIRRELESCSSMDSYYAKVPVVLSDDLTDRYEIARTSW